jgi:pimeloyl-ACP methyl ester carboxylesterase
MAGPSALIDRAASLDGTRCNFSAAGEGKPVLLVHGIGSSTRVWRDFVPPLARDRRVVAVDLPGHGNTPAWPGSDTFLGLVAALERFIDDQDLDGADMVGSSLGGRLVLELARRGHTGAVVALDPGGFWIGWERTYLQATLLASLFALRTAKGLVPALAHNATARSLVLAQLSARPWSLDGDDVEAELMSFIETSTFVPLVNDLAVAPKQEGPAAPNAGKIAVGWGRHDRLCWPAQAWRAKVAFPSAELHWFEKSGHYPLWDEPEETLGLIRRTIS